MYKNHATSISSDDSIEEEVEPKCDHSKNATEVGTFRRNLPQFLACMAKNLLLLDLGMAIAFPTIAIPVLRGLQPDPNEVIHMTAEQSTWVGSLLFLTEPLGSMSSGWITEQCGRKRSMVLAIIPHIMAWTLLYFAHSAAHVFVAASLLGLGAGLLGSPVAVYVGEISHPSIRGILLSFSGICKSFGLFLMFTLGSLTTWRMSALYALAVPLLAVVSIYFIPESPHWLIANRRPDDAIRSLQWLRGWVSAEAVAAEFAELNHYIDHADACDSCRLLAQKCTHRSTYRQKIRDIFRPKTLRPLRLLILMFFVVQISANSAIRPYLVQIFTAFRLPIAPNWASVVVSMADILSGVLCIFAIPMFGKRRLFLVSLVGVAAFTFAIAINAFVLFEPHTSTFHNIATISNNSRSSPLPHLHDSGAKEVINDNYAALVLFIGLAACANVVNCMPWVLSSEVFPFRIRGTASGISSATSYICIFTAIKTYIYVEEGMEIFGAFVFYGAITVLGFVLLYTILPETENRSLEEIEQFFSDNTRRWNDRTIHRLYDDDDKKVAGGIDNAALEARSEVEQDENKMIEISSKKKSLIICNV